MFNQASPNLAQCQNSLVLTYSCTLLPWKQSRDNKKRFNVWPIFAEIGDGSGSNFIVAEVPIVMTGKLLYSSYWILLEWLP